MQCFFLIAGLLRRLFGSSVTSKQNLKILSHQPSSVELRRSFSYAAPESRDEPVTHAPMSAVSSMEGFFTPSTLSALATVSSDTKIGHKKFGSFRLSCGKELFGKEIFSKRTLDDTILEEAVDDDVPLRDWPRKSSCAVTSIRSVKRNSLSQLPKYRLNIGLVVTESDLECRCFEETQAEPGDDSATKNDIQFCVHGNNPPRPLPLPKQVPINRKLGLLFPRVLRSGSAMNQYRRWSDAISTFHNKTKLSKRKKKKLHQWLAKTRELPSDLGLVARSEGTGCALLRSTDYKLLAS